MAHITVSAWEDHSAKRSLDSIGRQQEKQLKRVQRVIDRATGQLKAERVVLTLARKGYSQVRICEEVKSLKGDCWPRTVNQVRQIIERAQRELEAVLPELLEQ